MPTSIYEKLKHASNWKRVALSPNQAKEIASSCSLLTNPANLDPVFVQDLLICALQADMDKLHLQLHAMETLGARVFDLRWNVHPLSNSDLDSGNKASPPVCARNICEMVWEENVTDSLVLFARMARNESEPVYGALIDLCVMTWSLFSAKTEKFWRDCYIVSAIIQPQTEQQARDMLVDPCLQGKDGMLQMIWRDAAETYLVKHCAHVFDAHIGPSPQGTDTDTSTVSLRL